MLDDRRRKSLEIEAIARITWGDTPGDVRAWLISQELPAGEADGLVRDCRQRRATEMRSLGIRDLIWGVPAIVVALLLTAIGIIGLDWIGDRGVRIPIGAYTLISVPLFLVGGYGCWRSVRGLDRLVFGSRADGPVTDVD